MRDNINNNDFFDNEFKTVDMFSAFKETLGPQYDEDLEETAELYATMGSQMEYTEMLKEKKDTRRLETMQFVEINPQKCSEITQKLVSIYGENSVQVNKWIEQINKIQYYKEEQKRLIARRKFHTIFIGILCAISMVTIIFLVFFALNSTTYYINDGDFRYIYSKTMIGKPECFIEMPAEGLIKNGSYLYYKNIEDDKLYKVSTRQKEPNLISQNSIKEFRISKDTIYYINKSDNKLYEIKTDGTEERLIVDSECKNLNIKDGKVYYDTENETKSLE